MALVFLLACFPAAGELVVTGTFEDAVLGQPIERFIVTPGQPKIIFGADQSPVLQEIHWHDQLRLPFQDGQFLLSLSEPLEQDFGTPGDYIFRFEADGYQSATTPVIKLEAEYATLRVTTERSDQIRITVNPPEGSALDMKGIRVQGQGIPAFTVDHPMRRFFLQDLTDIAPDGTCIGQLDDPYAATYFTAYSDQGIGEANFELTPPNVLIQLQPWGSIAGTLTRGGKPLPGVALYLSRPSVIHPFENGHTSVSTLPGVTPNISILEAVQTDDLGRFQFDRVAPGENVIGQKEGFHHFEFVGRARSQPRQGPFLKSIFVEPCERQMLDIQLSEIVVEGTIRWRLTEHSLSIAAFVEPSDMEVPDPPVGSIEERQQWIHDWYWSEDRKAKRHWLGGEPRLLPSGQIVRGVPIPLPVTVDHQGHFEIPDLALGSYQLNIFFYKDRNVGLRSPFDMTGAWQHQFSIPDNFSEKNTLHLGEIQVPGSGWESLSISQGRKKQMQIKSGIKYRIP